MITFKINKKRIGENYPTYFIADIAANHDGSLARAKKLIKLSALAGADAVKFQHFKAETIVSDYGFKKLGKFSHQKKWKKSVFEIYKAASINNKWNSELYKTCKKYKIDFLTAPYDLEYIDQVSKFICAYKIGSGDITWHEAVKKISKKRKPVILASGASSIEDVKKAITLINKYNKKIVLMQCNTNYTASEENYKFINLNALNTFKKIFKNKIILGLSDHTFGSETVLGAISLGARVVEKHFTDDNNRNGPDHKFSMNPNTWREMIDSSRRLEKSFGNGKKIVEKNERDTVIIQRRSLRASKKLSKNTILKHKHIIALRPCPKNAISPDQIEKVLGKKVLKNMNFHEHFTWKKIR